MTIAFVNTIAMPRPATKRISVAMMGCMRIRETSIPFHMPAADAYQQRRDHRHDDGVLGMAGEISADENRDGAGRDRHDGADGNIDSVRRDDQRHARSTAA